MKIQSVQSTISALNLCAAALLAACSSTGNSSNDEQTQFNINEITIDQVHGSFKQAKLTCNQLVSIYINRIKEYDKSTKLNAIVLINPNAFNRARRLDQEFTQTGKLRSLHCVPVILKDNYDTSDMPTTAGSIALKNSYPPDDAHVVKLLRDNGAVILAKSNMAEWAFSPYYTVSSTAGITRNAYDMQRVPAGSSGGTASAVAANFGLVGMGTDTGNSIRGPASHTSLVGIRATIGVVSRDGVIPLLYNRDVAGPMTRTVEDAARVFNVISGYDVKDQATERHRNNPEIDYLASLKKDGLKGVRIGVLRELAGTETADFEINELFEQAIVDIRALGAEIVDPFVILRLNQLAKATGFCSRFRFDINNYFTSLGDSTPVKNLAEVYTSKQYHELSEGGLKWGMSVPLEVAPEQQEVPCIDVIGDPRRLALRNAVVNAMNEQNVGAIIYPTWNNPPRLVGDLESPHGNNSPLISPHADQPSITVPMGFTSDGLPAGLQFLARPFGEAALFQFAYAYEQASHHRKPPLKFP